MRFHWRLHSRHPGHKPIRLKSDQAGWLGPRYFTIAFATLDRIVWTNLLAKQDMGHGIILRCHNRFNGLSVDGHILCSYDPFEIPGGFYDARIRGFPAVYRTEYDKKAWMDSGKMTGLLKYYVQEKPK